MKSNLTSQYNSGTLETGPYTLTLDLDPLNLYIYLDLENSALSRDI
jgi:hypothetical protein